MEFFKALGEDLSYNDVLQLDGAFSAAHINYDNSPVFDGRNSADMTVISRKNSLSIEEKIDEIDSLMRSFNGIEKNLEDNDRISLWENYWREYTNAFEKLTEILPHSVVTIHIGRQAVEIGFKFLLLKKTGKITKTHDLAKLSDLLFTKYAIGDSYMNGIDLFCKRFCEYVEGKRAEYFRYPEYAENTFFAGNHLSIEWLSYNFALIILKLLHFANLDADA